MPKSNATPLIVAGAVTAAALGGWLERWGSWS